MVQREKHQCVVLKVLTFTFHKFLYGVLFLDSSMVEHSAVNRVVAGSSPARGVDGLVVKRLRHRPFTAVTRVRIPSRSFELFLTNSLQHDILIESCEFNIYGAVAKW